MKAYRIDPVELRTLATMAGPIHDDPLSVILYKAYIFASIPSGMNEPKIDLEHDCSEPRLKPYKSAPI